MKIKLLLSYVKKIGPKDPNIFFWKRLANKNKLSTPVVGSPEILFQIDFVHFFEPNFVFYQYLRNYEVQDPFLVPTYKHHLSIATKNIHLRLFEYLEALKVLFLRISFVYLQWDTLCLRIKNVETEKQKQQQNLCVSFSIV